MARIILMVIVIVVILCQLRETISTTKTKIENHNAVINAAIEGSQK